MNTEELIEQINQELNDANTAEIEAKKRGLRVGEYDLSNITAAVTKDRAKAEIVDVQNQGGVTRYSGLAKQVADQTGERIVRTPPQQKDWVDANLDKNVQSVIPYDPSMLDTSIQLQDAVKKYPNATFNKVAQMTDTRNLVDGKPTMWLEPYYEKDSFKTSEPNRDDFASFLDQDYEYQVAMKKYYGDDYTHPKLEKKYYNQSRQKSN